MRYARVGGVSRGTLKDEDLLSNFAWELNYHVKRQPKRFKRRDYRKLINEAHRCLANDRLLEERGSELVEELVEALNVFAPSGMYFGPLEGNGSDYGFWVERRFVDDFDGLRVEDTGDVPDDYRGEVLEVSDHGNATLYVATARGKLRELWAVV